MISEPCPPCKYDPCVCDESLRLQEEFEGRNPLLVKRYKTIVVDPPWNYTQHWNAKGHGSPTTHGFDGAFHEGTSRGAATQYSTMGLEEIAALSIGRWADEDAHLYLWVTNAFMEHAFPIARAWGFEPKTILTWVKSRLGMGMYYRNNTEHVIFAVRGRLACQRKDARTSFTGEQGQHSEKPAAFYDMVESMSPGPYLDVFARKLRFNWDAWGDEVGAPEGLPTPERVRESLPLTEAPPEQLELVDG